MRFWISVLDVRNVSVVPLVALPLEFMQDAFMTHYNVGIAVCARGGGTARLLGIQYGRNSNLATPVAQYSVPIMWAGRGSTRTADFERALDAALECEADNRAILVHCRSSFDRAPALLSAFMRAIYSWTRGLCLVQTLCLLAHPCPFVAPHECNAPVMIRMCHCALVPNCPQSWTRMR